MNTRRTFLTGAAGLALVPAPMAAGASVQAPHLDAALMAAIAAFRDADAWIEAFDAGEFGDEDADEAVAAWYEALEAVMAIPAKTSAGLQAKVVMAHKILQHTLVEDQADPAETREEHFAVLVLGEIAGSAAA